MPGCNAKKHRLRSRFWAGTALASGLQSNTDHVQLRTRESVTNGQAPVNHQRAGDHQWVSLGSALVVAGPEEATKMVHVQRMLQGLTG